MTIYEKIGSDLKEAMKSGDASRRDVVRMIGSALKNEAIERRKPSAELSDDECVAVLRRLVKQRRESAESYRIGNRFDLAEREEAELAIVSAYLPADLSEQEILSLIAEAKEETGVSSKSDFVRLMGCVAKKVALRADGNLVKRLVEEALS